MGLNLPPNFEFPAGTKSLGINLAVLRPSAPEGSAKRPTKYRNVRTAYNGRVYDSKREAGRAEALDIERDAGLILEWTPQPIFHLSDARIVYRADFLVVGLGATWVEDVKGVATAKFRDVVKLWRTYKRVPLHVLYRDHTEIIEPIWSPSPCSA